MPEIAINLGLIKIALELQDLLKDPVKEEEQLPQNT
jgi:hypothetical protein